MSNFFTSFSPVAKLFSKPAPAPAPPPPPPRPVQQAAPAAKPVAAAPAPAAKAAPRGNKRTVYTSSLGISEADRSGATLKTLTGL